MIKKSIKILSSSVILGLVLATSISTGNIKAAKGKVDRFGGTSRYETAAKVAKSNWKLGQTKNIILVSGKGYADALSASLLAKKLNAPILLTGRDILSIDTKKTIDELGIKNIYILGSEGVISRNIQSSLEKEGKRVQRLAGKNRFETNKVIANELVNNYGVKADEVLVVNGNRYLADALTAAPVAAKEGKILLLVGEDENTADEAKKFVDEHKSKVTVIGTDVTVSGNIYKRLSATKRVNGGKDRFETNRLVLKSFGVQGTHLYVANGQNNHLVDSLVASALAGKFDSPVVLVSNDETTDNKAIEYIKNELKITYNTDLNAVGSEAILSEGLIKKIENIVLHNQSQVNNKEEKNDSLNPKGEEKVEGLKQGNKSNLAKKLQTIDCNSPLEYEIKDAVPNGDTINLKVTASSNDKEELAKLSLIITKFIAQYNQGVEHVIIDFNDGKYMFNSDTDIVQ